MQQTFQRDRFTWLAYLLLAFYGYFLNILGPITPFLKDELRLSYTVSSLHFTAFAVGILLIGLGGHIIIQRIGRERSFWVGAIGVSVGAILLISARNPIVTIGACFLMGLVGSLILVIIPSGLSDRHGEQRAVAFSEANVVSSVVAACAPLLVGWFAHYADNWRLALGFVAFTPVFIRLGFGKVSFPAATPEQIISRQNKEPLPIQFWVYWVAIVLAVSAEFCMISWSADYMEKGLGMLKADAAQAVSLFLAGMIIGRMAGGNLVQRYSSRKLIIASIVIASLGFIIFWTASSPLLGMSGLFITGLGIASQYPLILSMAIGVVGNNSVQASARATLASGTAILLLPLVLGRLADSIGIRGAYGIVIFLFISVFLSVQFAKSKTLLQLSGKE